MSTIPLNKRQREILDFYEQYTRAHSVSPTLEETASHFGINKVTVFGHVEELRKKGALERFAKNKSRSMVISAPVGQPSSSPQGNAGRLAPRLPLVGSIAAGSPIEAVEYPEELDLSDLVPPGRDCYALRVKGTSMIEDGIRDGDIVLVERRDTARRHRPLPRTSSEPPRPAIERWSNRFPRSSTSTRTTNIRGRST